MTRLTDVIFNEWSYALGWTLLHSLWQSLVVLLVVLAVLRLVPGARSATRYAVATAGFFLLLVVSCSTYIYLTHHQSAAPASVLLADYDSPSHFAGEPTVKSFKVLPFLSDAVQRNMPVILTLWGLGFIVFSLRLSAGLFYTYRIRTSAIPITNEWNRFVARSAMKMGIVRRISLAESASIAAPIVLGYFRPLILLPVGMLTGLTTEQLETIFVHELAHIRRRDYIMNLIQSVVEPIFFFNPFVWILSDIIRTEREYCCDDLVVSHHGGTKAYAYALAQLAEARLALPGFALALAHDKNQLLNRIKRIMEKSVETYSGKSRLVIPAILLVGALFCISWLGTDGYNGYKDTSVAQQDTVPKKKQNGATYSRRSIITIDENGQPHEEVVEEFEGDEKLRPLMQHGLPAIPDISAIPPMPGLPVDPMLPDIALQQFSDTIPPGFRLHDLEEWDAFAKSFEEHFSRNFEHFHHLKPGDSSGIMNGFPENFNLPDFESFQFPDHARKALEHLEQSYGKLDEQLERMRDLNLEHLRHFDQDFRLNNNRMQSYQEVLREELIKDGYLSNDESIESLQWNDDSFKVNGKPIKKADQEKYQKLNRKFFEDGKTVNKKVE